MAPRVESRSAFNASDHNAADAIGARANARRAATARRAAIARRRRKAGSWRSRKTPTDGGNKGDASDGGKENNWPRNAANLFVGRVSATVKAGKGLKKSAAEATAQVLPLWVQKSLKFSFNIGQQCFMVSSSRMFRLWIIQHRVKLSDILQFQDFPALKSTCCIATLDPTISLWRCISRMLEHDCVILNRGRI